MTEDLETRLEHRLTDLLEESAQHLAVPVHTIVAAATVRGRRMRGRRRLRVAGAALTVVLLTGGVGLACRDALPSATAPAAGPSAVDATAHGDQALARTLTTAMMGVLPPGGRLTPMDGASVAAQRLRLNLRYDNGIDNLPMTLTVQPAESAAGCWDEQSPERIGCKGATTADGVVVTSGTVGGTMTFDFRPNRGFRVMITVADGLLDQEVWQRAVEDERWQRLAAEAGLVAVR